MKRSLGRGLCFWVLSTFCLLVCETSISAPARAQEKKDPSTQKSKTAPQVLGSEKGSFQIFVEGQEKGTEEFEVVPVGNRFVAKGKIHLTITRDEKPVQYFIDSELEMQPDFNPIRYTMVQKFEGNSASIKMLFGGEKATAEFITGSGTEKRDYQLAPDVAVLDDNVFHQYALLARRYNFDRSGLQEFSAFIPQESIGGILHVLYKGDEKIEVNGKTEEVQHLVVDTNDLKIELYVEGKDHRMVKMEVPSSQVTVVRVN